MSSDGAATETTRETKETLIMPGNGDHPVVYPPYPPMYPPMQQQGAQQK